MTPTPDPEVLPTTYRRTGVALILIAFFAGGVAGAGVYATLTEKPAPPPFQVRVPAGKAHATASMTAQPATEADAVLRRLAFRTSCVPDRDGVVTYSEVEGCILASLTALQTPNTREAQPGTVTPQPYTLHPHKTPLADPTQDAYYRSLFRDGRFPTTGSDPGRPQ